MVITPPTISVADSSELAEVKDVTVSNVIGALNAADVDYVTLEEQGELSGVDNLVITKHGEITRGEPLLQLLFSRDGKRFKGIRLIKL